MKRTHEVRTSSAFLIPALLLGLSMAPAWAKDEAPMPKGLPPFGQDKPLPVAQIAQSTLKNGLTVWIVPRPGLPRLVIYLAVRGGTAADPADMLGMSQVMAEALKGGTPSRTSQGIAEELQAVGADLSTEVRDDAFVLSAQGLSSGAATMLGVLSDVAKNASFPEAEVELAKANAIQGLLYEESQPSTIAEKAWSAAVFGDHPYHLVVPTQKAIESTTPDLLRREFRRRFRPDRSLLVLAGAMDPKKLAAEIDADFGSWKGEGPAVPPTPPVPPGGTGRILVVDRPASVQSEIRVGRAAIKATEPDYYALVMANTLLGASGTSRLYKNIREDKGYTYTPGSALSTHEQGGTVEAQAAVRNEVTAGALLEIFYEFDRLGATLPADEELARAKRFQTGVYLLRNETGNGVAGSLATYWIRGQDPSALTQFVSRVGAVTGEQIRAAGRKYLNSRQQIVAVVGDAKAVTPELEQFGKVEQVTP